MILTRKSLNVIFSANVLQGFATMTYSTCQTNVLEMASLRSLIIKLSLQICVLDYQCVAKMFFPLNLSLSFVIEYLG